MPTKISEKIIVFTDLHFGIHSNSQSYIDICENTLKWIESCCTERGIGEVLFMGDFFDSRASIDVRTFNSATNSLYSLADGGVKVTMILGNHDIYLRDSTSIHSLLAFGGRSGIRIVDEPEVVESEGCGATALLLPWMFGTSDRPVDVPADTRYVFSHHNFPSNFFMGGAFSRKRNRSDSYASKTPYEDEYGIQQSLLETIVENRGMFYSGHVHQHKVIPLRNGANIVIEGSPYETSWGFGGAECGAYAIDFAEGVHEFIPNPYNMKHVEIRTSSAEKDMEGVDFRRSIVRLSVDTQESFDAISKLQAKIGSMKPFSVENTRYEFKAAEFVGNTEGSGDGASESVCGKVSSKLDYIIGAIDRADFSSFAYPAKDGKQKSVDKGVLKELASKLYEGGRDGK